MPQPICFIDNKYYTCGRFPEIIEAFADYPDICQVSRNSFQFKVVGVLSANGQPIVVFPKNYQKDADESALISDAKTLARVIIRYRNEARHSIDELKLLYGDSNMSSGRIAAAMFLLDDYCRNGYLSRQVNTVSTETTGRIDWTATINKCLPVITNRRPFYPLPVMRRKETDDNNIIVLAHKFVIGECFREWGWFFGYDDFSQHIPALPVTVEKTIHCLEAELKQTYQEREIHVIKYLIQYLTEKTGNEKNGVVEVMATQYFSFVWESICGYLMDNQYPKLKPLLPQPEWESDCVSGNISQRPDIFLVRNKGLYILDAKYYDYNQNLPGWHDVVKQFFYRHTIERISKSLEFTKTLPEVHAIYNGFLFPGNTDDCTFIGRVHVPRIEDLGEVKAFAINQKKAFSAYAYRDNSPFAEELRTKITRNFQQNDAERGSHPLYKK